MKVFSSGICSELQKTFRTRNSSLKTEDNLLPSALTMSPNCEEWFFQQDNAPCHTARSVKVWMKDHQIRTLSSWPAQSPDLNPIENLWNVIQRKMDGHKPSNKANVLKH